MGRKPRGVRLDSGDLVVDSIWTRQRLDSVGWGDVEIFASGDLDEERIAKLLASGARIDTFGVGTSLSVSADAPSLNVLYKLVEVERDGVPWGAAKLSAAKVTYPGRKQVYRASSAWHYAGDVIALEDEPPAAGEPLLVPVLRKGERINSAALPREAPAAPLREAQVRCREQLERLPPRLRELAPPAQPYSVGHSAKLEALLVQVRERIARMSPA
jgi:nicotinate phosphoribosyltransferase